MKALFFIIISTLLSSIQFAEAQKLSKTLPSEKESNIKHEYDQKTGTYNFSPRDEELPTTSSFQYTSVNGFFIADVFLGKKPSEGKIGFRVSPSTDDSSPIADFLVEGNDVSIIDPDGKIQVFHREYIDFLRLENRDSALHLYLKGENSLLEKVGEIRSATIDINIGFLLKNIKDEASFYNLRLIQPVYNPTGTRALTSRLEILDINTLYRNIVYENFEHFEAPNWSRDGKKLIFNQEGQLYKISVNGGKPKLIKTGNALKLNNDHGLSPDGKMLAISNHDGEFRTADNSTVYVLPSKGGKPKKVTTNNPSYWHGWSPDGKTLAYVGRRNGQYDIYTIPVEGGEETRLTTAEGLDDGPDYSPDGKYIFFNSERTGSMDIWRMDADGKNQTQLTDDQFQNWFPHPSPDGKWVVFLSYPPEVGSNTHPASLKVMLRMIPLEGGPIKVLAYLYGGQGTINVPSWSPDSQKIAFVSYSY